jgi:PAS domain S-box-containing protein
MTDPHSDDGMPPPEAAPGAAATATQPGGRITADDLYRTCIDSAPYGVLIHDLSGCILLYNRQLELITGYSHAEIRDIPTWMEILYPDPAYRSLVIHARQQAWTETGVRTREAMITRKDGQVRMCRFTSSQPSAQLRVVFVRDIHQGFEIDEQGAQPSGGQRKDPVALLSWVNRDGGFYLCGFNAAAEKWAGDGLAARLAAELEELFPDRPDIREDMRRCLANWITIRRKMLLPFTGRGAEDYVTATYAFCPPVFITLRLEDLSELQRAEQKLERSERKFIEFADMLPEIVFEADPRGRLRFVNRSGLDLMGFTADELRQNLIAFDFVHPQDRPRAEANFREVLRGADLGVNEYTFVRRDGRTFTALLRSTLLLDGGTILGIRGFIIDISERKIAEDDLRASEEKFAQMFHASPYGYAITTFSDGRYLEANATESLMTGYSREELIGRSAIELGFYEDPEDGQRIRRLLVERGSIDNYPVRYCRKSGEIRWGLLSARLIDFNGERCLLSTVTDATELHNAEEQLKRSHEQLEQRVTERTAELTAANQKLKQQIQRRLEVERKLRSQEADLKRQANDLLEMNATLKVLLKKRDEGQREIEEKIGAHLKRMVLPYVEKLMRSKLPPRPSAYVAMLESNLKDIASPLAKNLSDNLYNLTPTEIQVISLIKIDKSTKQIASELNLSPKTVEFHRYNIRRKLGLGKKRLNLQSFLKTMK